jgi:Flp pilus assembly protein TadD
MTSMRDHIHHKPYIGKSILFSVSAWLLGSLPLTLQASACDDPAAQAVSIQGQVEVKIEGTAEWTPVQQNDELCPGDTLRVGADSRAGINLKDDTLLRLAEHSSIRINAPRESGSAWLDLMEGIAHFISRVRHSFQVNTPYVNASIEGTEFTVESDSDSAAITVLEGRVKAENAHGNLLLSGGQKAVAQAGKPPTLEQVVDPLDAVKWTLYYPPVNEAIFKDATGERQRSFEAYQEGDLKGAFDALAKVPEREEDPDLLVYRASLHLLVGKVDAAHRDLDQALHLKPEHGDALALLSVIATVNNERKQAIELAQRALESDPRGVPPLLALSYAKQAQYQLSEARDAARQATEADPESALAWSRLAQLHLMFRQLDEGTEAAWKAAKLAPDQPEPLATLGFAHLLEPDLKTARQAFRLAIKRDQAAPMPRLGYGLLKIREGEMEEGRRQLEIAANLDPGNAVIRSYLGKAYYEEKRNDLASTQFALSKDFDERDPTPWFYEAILLQSENRPIEALNALQTSIDLNDNRAVYRSRFLLDQDAAARNASQARIYQDLGFEQLARNDAYKSLQTSAHSHSAHRLLADSYSGEPRLEKARFSELLQSQLLQPLNSNPIQPQLAVSKLGVLDGAGPSSSGFSEYTPLFTRSGLDLQLNAIGGSNEAWGDDLILSGLGERLAFSFGQYHYETDGWRENNDLEQDVYNAFVQFSLSPSTSLQFEYRYQDAESGDLAFSFDPDDFNPYLRNDLKRRVGRIGFHHQFGTNGHLIASIIEQDIMDRATIETSTDLPAIPTPFGPLPGTLDTINIESIDATALTRELQYTQQLQEHTFTLGGGLHRESSDFIIEDHASISVPIPVPPFLLEAPVIDSLTVDEMDPRFTNIYLYSLLSLPENIGLTLGITHEKIERLSLETTQTNPKFGLTWEAINNLTVRAVYLESLTRPRNMEQSIEQTQIAGFNQFYDDFAGSEIKQFGLGVDALLSRDLSTGVEYVRRDLQVPFFVAGISDFAYEGRDEELSRLYLYWKASKRLGLSLTYEREAFERSLFSPESLTTDRVPLGISYHWASGIYFLVEGTYVNQEISQSSANDEDTFWNIDGVLGYRFPNRLGKIEIITKNFLDEEFNYYDMSFHSGEFLTPRYQPERQIFARLTLNF